MGPDVAKPSRGSGLERRRHAGVESDVSIHVAGRIPCPPNAPLFHRTGRAHEPAGSGQIVHRSVELVEVSADIVKLPGDFALRMTPPTFCKTGVICRPGAGGAQGATLRLAGRVRVVERFVDEHACRRRAAHKHNESNYCET